MGVLDTFRLNGRRAVVTGASRGLGRSMALALADSGADVIITGRTMDRLNGTAEEIRSLGQQAWTVQADMSIPSECQTACERIIRDYDPIDILINNVGNREMSVPIEAETLETWSASIDFNLTSCFLATKIIGGAMLQRGTGGRIINIASMSGLIVNRGIGGRGYEAGKAAVIHFTRATAADWAPSGIMVNAICPGLFMTDMNREWSQRRLEAIQAILQNVPIGRAGEPAEIGPLAVYLASPAASYVTGATFVIDGGYTVW